jgi:hypothetical protein
MYICILIIITRVKLSIVNKKPTLPIALILLKSDFIFFSNSYCDNRKNIFVRFFIKFPSGEMQTSNVKLMEIGLGNILSIKIHIYSL